MAHPRDAADRFFHRISNFDGHPFGRAIAGIKVYLNPGEIHPGKEGHRQAEATGQSAQGQHRHQEEQGTAVGLNPLGDSHGAASTLTAMPSLSS